MRLMMRLFVYWMIGLSTACVGPTPADDSAATTQLPLHGKPAAASRSSAFLQLDFLPAGVAADRDVVFVGSPLEGRVLAMAARTRQPLGELPAPPEGFILPLISKSVGRGLIAVLDAGGLPSPSPFVPASPTIYEYAYRLGPKGAFAARLVRSLRFKDVLVGFAEDIVRLDDGSYILSDAVLGALWQIDPDGEVSPGIVAKSSAAEDAIQQLRVCDYMPTIDVGGIPFLFSGRTIPGVSPIAVRHGQLYFYSPCAEGLYRVPLSVFSDSRPPHERASDIRLVSPKDDDVLVEQLLALTFDSSRPQDPYLYAADSLQMRIVQIDVRDGSRRIIASDPTLFNFPSSMAILPRPGCRSSLLVISNQQHRLTLTNDAITEDLLEPPFLMTEVDFQPGGR